MDCTKAEFLSFAGTQCFKDGKEEARDDERCVRDRDVITAG